MKLVPRLSLVLVLIMSVVFVGRAWLRTVDESAHFESDMRRDHVAAAHALRAGVAEIWDLDGPERAKRLVESANLEGAALHFRWLETTEPNAHLSSRDVGEILSGRAVQRVAPGAPAEELISYFAVRPGTPSFGLLELRESLSERDEYMRASVRATAASVGLMIAAFWLVAMVTGRWIVGRPVDALLTQARRIGAGDLATPLYLHGPREFRALAEEMNRTCDMLSAAQTKVAEETDARARALEQLRHADRLATVGKLAAGVAHEIGTPLSVVAGHAQMIAGREVTGDRAIESARVIDAQVDRVARIVRQLLDFARSKGPERGASDALEVAASTLQLLEPEARKRSIELRAEGLSVLAAIDAESLGQVVTNLVVNAIHATPERGSVRVSVERTLTAPPGQAESQPFVRVDVKDSGTGIPEDVLPRVFDPFFTTKPTGEGTGLGLSVVHGIVQDHGGWITVDTSSGRGTTFSAFFPLASRSPAP
ncbi:hypothetical protein BH11MYX4_BH11MYX4_00950 [soil metagenome]